MPNPYEQTGQNWWDTTQEMEYYWDEVVPNEGYTHGSVFNMGLDFWNDTLSPYISDAESEAGINPLGMVTGWGNLIAPTGNIPGIGEFGGIDPQSHWQIGQTHDIQQGVLGSKFATNKKLADRKLGYTGLLGSSNSSLYEDYLSDSSSLQDLTQDSYDELYSDYGESINLGIDAANLAGAYGSGTYIAGGDPGDIEISDTLYEDNDWEALSNNQNFQVCVEAMMQIEYGLTPEGFAEAANYCYNSGEGL